MSGKVFARYEPRWSPIREIVAAAVTYSQLRCSQRAALSHDSSFPQICRDSIDDLNYLKQ